jgi:hypothetical protein
MKNTTLNQQSDLLKSSLQPKLTSEVLDQLNVYEEEISAMEIEQSEELNYLKSERIETITGLILLKSQ